MTADWRVVKLATFVAAAAVAEDDDGEGGVDAGDAMCAGTVVFVVVVAVVAVAAAVATADAGADAVA